MLQCSRRRAILSLSSSSSAFSSSMFSSTDPITSTSSSAMADSSEAVFTISPTRGTHTTRGTSISSCHITGFSASPSATAMKFTAHMDRYREFSKMDTSTARKYARGLEKKYTSEKSSVSFILLAVCA